MASVLYHCPCLSTSSTPPPPHLPSSKNSFHPLHRLFFCEECDAVRCNRCVSVEVSGYYCPNCLFEVPSASVRAEKNRWDSSEVGITFEKPTGLAAQLQKLEDSAPDALEFDRLKEHFEPILRASSLSPSSSSALPAAGHSRHHSNPITAAAAAALARDIPGVGKHTPHTRSGRPSGKDRSANKDEIPEYKSRVDISRASTYGSGGGDVDVDFMRRLESLSEVASLEQRWMYSWSTSLETRDLRPLRIPLHSKQSKRCPACTHILIKPEQKAQSVRYKIKLVAANYLPAITVALPHQVEMLGHISAEAAKRSAKAPQDDDRDRSGLQAGKTYPFHMALTNPLYDPIQVRLSVQRMHVAAASHGEGSAKEKTRRPPFAISIPTAPFSIAPFAEAWEYDDDEDMFGLDDEELEARLSGREKDTRAKSKTVGVLEKKANVTVVGGEVALGKEAHGEIKFNMLVAYTYRSDDPTPSDGHDVSPSKKAPETKTFAFYTVVNLGMIIPKNEPRLEVDEI
ncbi:hypothetical protein D9757_007058 [Collybiopsis confluens]|uniref:Dynactin subunit 4 n=1 Tax=Collybiopsis confluens TaxID=2823264 RepID=A0A8H5M4A1_9AGAR|nr:hypothetical protein D9757_007058 [Collybiopsis confluens]